MHGPVLLTTYSVTSQLSTSPKKNRARGHRHCPSEITMITDSICDEVDLMPTSFEGMKALSESFIKRALWGLLIESSDRKILQAPYGRPTQPTPLINLSDFLKNGGLDESDVTEPNDEPEFCYDYGFDPLQYIADYLKNLHPDNIRRLKEERIAIVNRLTLRANHARKVINNFRDLTCLTKRLRSGILWGPLTSPFLHRASSSSTVMCACRVVKKGNLIVELSKDSNFDNLENCWNLIVNDESITQKVKMTDVDPGTNYFIRCYMKEKEPAVGTSILMSKTRLQSDSEPTVDGNSSGSFEGEQSFFEHSQMTSIPTDEENCSDINPLPVGKIKIVAVNISSALLSTTSILNEKESLEDTFLITCLLGELFSAPIVTTKSFSRDESYDELDFTEIYSKQSFDLHRYSESFNDSDSVLRKGLLLLAWHDLSSNSDTRLNDEEASIKRYITDTKKYNSKCGKIKLNKSQQKLVEGAPPVQPRLRSFKTSPELAEVLQTLPIECCERADKPIARQLYSTSMIGLHIQLFVLDHRRGYMGKDQVAWLTEALESSSARFKIIVSGTPFGMSFVDTQSLNGGCSQHPMWKSYVDPTLVAAAVNVNASADDSLDDAECSDDRIASVSSDGFVMSKDSPDVGMPAPASVSMQVAPPILALGRDDGGRLNLSLSAVIAAYQMTCIRRKAEKMQVDAEVGPSDYATFAQDSLAPRPNRKVFTAGWDGEEDKHRHERLCSIELESGLLILSAGACVSINDQKLATDLENRKQNLTASRDGAKEARRRAAAGNKSSTDSDVFHIDGVVTPFAATYDPKGTGRPYCFELCVGGGEGIGCGASGSYLPVATPALGAELLYTAHTTPSPEASSDQSAAAIDTYSAVVTLSDDGYSLGLQLLSLKSSQQHIAIFNCQLTVPS